MSSKRLGILVGGGPAPGINSVISAATIRAIQHNKEVIGIYEGYRWIMRGDISKIKVLTIDDVSRIHFRGGSYIGTARDNPTTKDEYLETAITSLLRLNVDTLITIGGDDTAYSALRLAEVSNGRIHVVHVPKTIDNDLNLPYGIPTFGFQTARHLGVKLVENLMVDAKTTLRWYLAISMGRSAGHLALGIGKASGATLTLIPEEFREEKLKLKKVVDTIVGAIIKRLSYGKPHGVAIIAEGIVNKIDESDLEHLKQLDNVERDEHGHIRIAEIDIGNILKSQVQQELKRYGIKMTIVSKNIGYELRCADPIPFDTEYTRDLGFSAAEYVINGGSEVLISMQNSKFVPIPLRDLINPETKKMKVRNVDVDLESYKIAYQYMVMLKKEDFQDPHEIAKYSATCGVSLNEFEKRFSYTVQEDIKIWEMEEVKNRIKEYQEKYGSSASPSNIEISYPQSDESFQEIANKKVDNSMNEGKKNNHD